MTKEKEIAKKIKKHDDKNIEAPEKIQVRPLSQRERRKKFSQKITFSSIFGIIVGVILLFIKKDLILSISVFIGITVLIMLYIYFREKLIASGKIKKMEEVFPDFLQLMSSNLRAGITIDRSMLLSARAEFNPLDKEILKTGKDITAGKDIETALQDMAKRIGSNKITKKINLIISGIKTGGDVATLLEETAENMRERQFLEKKAASNVLMYVIFIFVAVAVGAPALFGLSNLLVEVLSTILSDLPDIPESGNMPLTLSSINISMNFILYFSIIFILVIDVLASLVLGLVTKGEEKEGLKYLIPIAAISLTVFFVVKFALAGFMGGLFA